MVSKMGLVSLFQLQHHLFLSDYPASQSSMVYALIRLLHKATRMAWEVVLEPSLIFSGLYESFDRAYGRLTIPFSPMEQRLYDNAEVKVEFGKAMLPNGKDWVWYQVWQDSDPTITRKGDIIFVHGTGVHSGTLAGHSRRYLKAGFRLIVPDLVSHGYSSGLHVYQTKMSSYTEGLHAVLHDVAAKDDVKDGIQRNKTSRFPTFMLGLSFGGTVALHYASDYPHSIRESPQDQNEVSIDGIVTVGAILGCSPRSLSIPPLVGEMVRFATHRLGLGRLELVVPHKKSLDRDPKVYKSLIDEDKRCHQGSFRMGHIVCIEEGTVRVNQNARNVRHAIYLQQGGQDQVACHSRSAAFIRRTVSSDKRMTIYPVGQHVIYRKAKTEEEDKAARVACIEDNVEWMTSRADLIISSLNAADILVKAEREAEWELFDQDEVINHPLLAKSLESLLYKLAKIAPKRSYRVEWNLAGQIRPYDIPVSSLPDEEKKHNQITSGYSR